MRRFPTLDETTIRDFANARFGIEAETMLLGGYLGRNAVWRIEPGGRVLKIFFASQDNQKYSNYAREKAEAEAFAYEVLSSGSFPVPAYVGAAEVKGYPAILYSYVPGTLWQDHPVANGAPTLPLYSELGTLLARIHNTALPVGPAPDHMKYFDHAYIVERALMIPAQYGSLMRQAEMRLREVTAALGSEAARGPKVLTHGDFTPRNLLLSDEVKPRIAAIIDWERARIADPVRDLAMVAYKEFLSGSGIKEAVLSGYLAVRALPIAADLLLEMHLLELFLEIAGWAINDDLEYFNRMLTALERLLAQDPIFQLSAPAANHMMPLKNSS